MIVWPYWLKPFSYWWKYNTEPSLNTKWHQISMQCFHFLEQTFPRTCLNKALNVSVLHFILAIPDYHHINFLWFPHFPSKYLFFMERVLGCNQSKWPWHSFGCFVAPEDKQLPLMLSSWCSIDLLIIFFFVASLYIVLHEQYQGKYLVLTYYVFT